MSQFDHIKARCVDDDATAPFTFEFLEDLPTLICRPATRINEGFFNAVLKAGKQAARKKKAIRKIKGKQKQDAAALKEAIKKARFDDIDLFVAHIVTGWEDVVNKKGKSVEFTPENLRDFLRAIPPEMFDDLRMFCLDIENFRPEAESMSDEEREDLQGN